MRERGGVPRPIAADEYRWLELERHAEIYLGRYRGRSCFVVAARTCAARVCDGWIRAWLGRVEPSLFYLAGRAQQIAEWHRDHQFCGRCGTEMESRGRPGQGVRRVRAAVLSAPRAEHDRARPPRRGHAARAQRAWPQGMYSTLAGFVEPGESVEQTMHREVFEEVGMRVKNLRYLGSQPWPFPHSLMLGFHADYAVRRHPLPGRRDRRRAVVSLFEDADGAARDRDLAVADRRLRRRTGRSTRERARAARKVRARDASAKTAQSFGVGGRLTLSNIAINLNVIIR